MTSTLQAMENERRQAMAEAGFIIHDAIYRALIDYQLTHAEVTHVILGELGLFNQEQLSKEWT